MRRSRLLVARGATSTSCPSTLVPRGTRASSAGLDEEQQRRGRGGADRRLRPDQREPVTQSSGLRSNQSGHTARIRHHLPDLRASSAGADADRRLPVLLRLQGLRRTPATSGRRLLRVLLFRGHAVPAEAGLLLIALSWMTQRVERHLGRDCRNGRARARRSEPGSGFLAP